MQQCLRAMMLTGIIAGLLLTFFQSQWVLPLIQQAETYEQGPLLSYFAADRLVNVPEDAALLSSTEPDPSRAAHEHEDEDDAWEPASAWQRLAATIVTNILLATGWASLLCTAFLFIRPLRWRHGLYLGIIGYLSFFVMPALLLPPELPGTESLALGDRKWWWIAAASSGLLGYSLLVFGRAWLLRFAGVVVVAWPHFFAPHMQHAAGTAPWQLLRQFQIQTSLVNALFWLVLGLLSWWMFVRLRRASLITS